MLAIRMQRTGRKDAAQFRLVVQDSKRTPTSGKIVAQIGYYNPHTKNVVLEKERANFYLSHGAQPSPRVITILNAEGIKIPKWVSLPTKKEGKVRNPEKLRANQPAQETVNEAQVEQTDTPVEETALNEVAQDEVPAETESVASKEE